MLQKGKLVANIFGWLPKINLDTYPSLVQGVSKKGGIWKSGRLCFISQVSNKFQQLNLIPRKTLVHCGYFEDSTFSDDEILTEEFLSDLLISSC